MPAPHAALTHELLVRCLDAWTPAALHGHRGAIYCDACASAESAAAALRVFGEFPDLLAKHGLTVLLGGDGEAATPDASPPGVTVRPGRGPVPAKSASFFYLDGYSPQARPVLAECLDAALAFAKAGPAELLVTLDQSTTDGGEWTSAIAAAGLGRQGRVELVDRDGTAVLAVFATGVDKSLERFKDELWALDEYAGIRYRDPGDPDGALLDISLEPHLGPLKRQLRERLAGAGPATLGALRAYALGDTLYRARDADRALPALVSSRAVTRTPATGRLTADTVFTAA